MKLCQSVDFGEVDGRCEAGEIGDVFCIILQLRYVLRLFWCSDFLEGFRYAVVDQHERQ